MNEDLFYQLNITEDGYVIARNNHDEADSVSIIGYTEESRHARLFVAAPEMEKLLGEMTVLLKINIRVGYERIIELGGQCDTPETMIKQHKEIALAEELLKSLK